MEVEGEMRRRERKGTKREGGEKSRKYKERRKNRK